jgi:alkanesulfonate monooxygenase
MAGARAVRIFTTCPRSVRFDEYRATARLTFALSERIGLTGTLIYTGNDVPVEPWLLAMELVQRHSRLAPLVAVNPIYMHPFTVARCVDSIASLHRRRVYLNLVAGTSLSDLEALDEPVGHDERYTRLREMAEIVVALCTQAAPLSYEGEFYSVRDLQLRAPLMKVPPGLLVAGQSAAAHATATRIGAAALGMLQPDLALTPSGARAVHFAVICRDSDEAAWRAAHAFYPEDDRGERAQRFAARNTDAVWKRRLLETVPSAGAVAEGYWLEPFRRFQLDCPLLVGGRERITRALAALIERGVDHLVLELPPTSEDYESVGALFANGLRLRIVNDELAEAT